MTEEKMLKIIEENFKKAIQNNEFNKFINGTGEYLIQFKDVYDFERTDSNRLIRGLENICAKYPDLNLNQFLENKLSDMLDSNDFQNTYGVLNFISAYLRRIESKNSILNIELKEILIKLKNKIIEQKEQMEKYKEGVFRQNNMYAVVENIAYDFELCGHKIL